MNSTDTTPQQISGRLSWHIPNQVMKLSLHGDYTLPESREVNDAITTWLEEKGDELSLLVDATQMERPHNFQQLRNAQHFMNHERLQNIFVAAGNDKLVKLSMLVIFNMARAYVRMFDNVAAAELALQRHLNS